MIVQLVHYFKHNNYFTQFQFGYRQCYSTVDAVLTIVNHIYDSFDAGETTIGVFLDLSKAFDTLNRNILFEKLKYYGINGIELQWFKSYFSERKKCVRYKDTKSEMLVTKYGVPQGSILGPILYFIYMNDVVSSSEILQFAMYADDTCVYNSNKSATDNARIMNSELGLVSRWLDRNCLTLNIKKCHYVRGKT